MAGLVLSAVGGQLAGAVGAQVAGAIGTMIDGALAGGGTSPREGARLADLKVQTSAYGRAIPRVFGTVRGCRQPFLVERHPRGPAGGARAGLGRAQLRLFRL